MTMLVSIDEGRRSAEGSDERVELRAHFRRDLVERHLAAPGHPAERFDRRERAGRCQSRHCRQWNFVGQRQVKTDLDMIR